MSVVELQPYAIPAAFAVFVLWRALRSRRVRARLPAMLANGAVVVDVRSPAEFAAGSVPGSLNLPLDQLERRAAELSPDRPVIVCCASGARSAVAAALLRRKGFSSVLNAGSWRSLAS